MTIPNTTMEELKRQCHIRHLPYGEVLYLVKMVIADHDAELREKIEAKKQTGRWGSDVVLLSNVLELLSTTKE